MLQSTIRKVSTQFVSFSVSAKPASSLASYCNSATGTALMRCLDVSYTSTCWETLVPSSVASWHMRSMMSLGEEDYLVGNGMIYPSALELNTDYSLIGSSLLKV